MNLTLARLLDYYLGSLLCWTLTFFKPLLPSRASKGESILLIELSEMGSAILLIPTIKQIKRDYPNAEISFLIFGRHKESVELSGLVNKVFTIDDRSLFKLALTSFKAVKELFYLKPKFVLDCELFSRLSTLLCFLSRPENSSGFVSPKVLNLYRGDLYSHPYAYNNLTHISENYLGLWRVFTAPKQDLPYLKEVLIENNLQIDQIEISKEKKLNAVSLITKKLGTKPKKLVIFNPDPGLISLRGWPIESFIKLGKRLIEEKQCQILIIGVSSANALAQRCCQELGLNCQNITGETPQLIDLLAVYSQATVLVTADSGPAHLASLSNLATIVLFGPESPTRFIPLGGKVIAISSQISCSPCLSAFNLRDSICNNNICMKKITVDHIYEKVCNFI